MIHKKIYIYLLIYLIVYFVLVVLVYYIESDVEGSLIKSFSDSLWFSIVTIASVGYGDKFPVTGLGKIVGSFFVLGSIFTLTFLISRVSDYYIEMRERKKMGFNGTHFSNHIIIVGWDNFSKLIVDVLLKESGKKIAIITDTKDHIDQIHQLYKNKEVFVLFSSMSDIETFNQANPKSSYLIFINRPTDTDKLITLLSLKQHYSLSNFMVTLDESNLKETFEAAGVKFVFSKNDLASKLIASYIFEPQVAEFNVDLISSAQDDNDFDTQQYLVLENNPYANKNYRYIFDDLKNKYNSILIGFSRQDGNTNKLNKLPNDNEIIKVNDYLVIINNLSSSKKIEELFGVKQGFRSK